MITINPENPSSDNPVVVEIVVFSNGCCEPSTSVVGSHFDFEMVPVQPPRPVLSTRIPFEIDWPVGRLKAGEYQVKVTDELDNSEIAAFTVSQGELPFPEPAIPTIGFAGAVLFALVLVWIANKALKTDAPKRAA